MSTTRARSFEYLDPEQILARPERRTVEAFLRGTRRTEIGWHYLVDLTWIFSQVMSWPRGSRVLDAGGGAGPTQFLLAELGFEVTNVDLFLRPPTAPIATRYRTSLRCLPSYRATDYVDHLAGMGASGWRSRVRRHLSASRAWQLWSTELHRYRHDRWRRRYGAAAVGAIDWIKGNLCDMPELASASFDGVVSLSALEHIPLSQLPAAMAELARVSTQDARLALTTSGTERAISWFHEPSKGHCFAASDLHRLFGAELDRGSASAEQVLERYRSSRELAQRLSRFYFASGNNGMPWGRWDPRYVPVGIRA